MIFVLNLIAFLILMGCCGLAYQRRSLWLRLIPYILLKWGEGRSFIVQLLIYSPVFVLWLLACRWLDVKGWHGVAAAGIGLAMLLGLQALRMIEENQKRLRGSGSES